MTGGGSAARRWRLVRARREAVPASARRFMRRSRRRRARAVLPWVLVAVMLVSGGAAVWICYSTSVFGVREVRVTGTDALSPLQVQQAAAIPTGMPLARVDTAAVRERVAALAPVDDVVVSRDWPHTVVVAVVERVAVAVVPQGNRFLVIDDEGVPFGTIAHHPAELPLARLAEPGPDDIATHAALLVLASLTDQLRAQLAAVVVDGPARIVLELRHDRKIIWGDATENETKASVATALLPRSGQVIDVSAPDVVSIR